MAIRSDELDARTARAVDAVLWTLLIVLPVVLVASALAPNTARLELVAIGALLGVVALLKPLLRKGRVRLCAHVLVFAMIAFTTASLVAYGSVRSVAGIGYLGAVIAGGMFLGGAALAAAAVLSSACIGAIVWLESGGLLPVPDLQVGLSQWVIHTAVIGAVASMIYYARELLLDMVGRVRGSERRMAALFRASPAALIVLRPSDGVVLEINEAYERMFRIRSEEMVGRPMSALQLWDSLADRGRYMAQLESGHRVADFRTRLRRRDGEVFEALISAEIVEGGGERQLLGTVMDLSGEVRVREALRASEARFRLAFDSSPIGMTITRVADGTFLAVNRADQRTLGYAPEEVLGRTSLETGTWPDADERARFVAKLRAERVVSNFETRMRNRDGLQVDCAIWAALVDIDGESCVLASTINITGQKREEALISEVARGVAGDTGEPFFRSLVAHLVQAAGADAAMVGTLVGEGRRVRTIARWWDGAMAGEAEYALAGSPCEAVLARGGVTVYPDRVGELFPHDAGLRDGGLRGYIGAPLVDGEGRPIGVLNLLSRRPLERVERLEPLVRIFAARAQAELVRMRQEQEILRISRELEDRVRERTSQLEAANKELESFSYSVSHDLRAPLRAIGGLTGILQEDLGGRLEAPQRKTFDRVTANVKRMGELIDDLLELARVSRSELRIGSVNLSRMAGEVLETLREREPSRRVRFSVAEGVSAQCDRELARIVLENLLGNAWKFTSKRAEASIEFAVVPLRNGASAYRVRDNGAGFDMAYAKRLFSPFQRLHGLSEFEGTGIGLATVQRIVARHGGCVWAEAAPDAGASFYFAFAPVAAEASSRVARA